VAFPAFPLHDCIPHCISTHRTVRSAPLPDEQPKIRLQCRADPQAGKKARAPQGGGMRASAFSVFSVQAGKFSFFLGTIRIGITVQNSLGSFMHLFNADQRPVMKRLIEFFLVFFR
jgi:hypothetical protein